MEGGRGSSKNKRSGTTKGAKVSLKDIASTTLKAVEDGSFEIGDTSFGLKESIDYAIENMVLFRADSELSHWSSNNTTTGDVGSTLSATTLHITVSECSTLVGARRLKELLTSSNIEDQRVGVLNFASAKNPGGGFMRGAQAQVRFHHRRTWIRSSSTTYLFSHLGRVNCSVIDDISCFDEQNRATIFPVTQERPQGRILQPRNALHPTRPILSL